LIFTNSIARFSLFLVYLAFFALNFTLVVWSWSNWYINTDSMVDLLKELVALYSTQFSVILAGIFGSQDGCDTKLKAIIPYIAGLLLVLLWCSNTAWPLLYLFWKAGPQGMNLGWALDYWKTAPVMTGFLCNAAITFWFLKANGQE